MGLIKVPPRFEMRAPPATTGVPFKVHIAMLCREAVPVQRVFVDIGGRIDVTIVNAFDGEQTRRSLVLSTQRHVLVPRPCELKAGRYDYAFDAYIAPHLPGRQHGPVVQVHWGATVHASIPWWPDVRRSFPLHVLSSATPPPAQARRPLVVASSLAGPAGRRPYAEVWLANPVVPAGGTIQGYVSLANSRFHHYRQLRLKLRQQAEGPFLGTGAVATASSRFLHLSAPRDHEPIPFQMPIPTTTGPAFGFHQLKTRWLLRCSVHSGHSAKLDVRLPITVLPASTPVPGAEAALPLPMIGSERIARAWSQAAADTGFSFDGASLSLTTDRAAIRLFLESDASGTRLAIDIRFRAVDIGLHVKRGRLRCHDAEQSRMIANATDTLTSWLRATYADNRHVSAKAHDGGTQRARVARYAQWAMRLAESLLDTREHLPPPANAVHLLPAFERAARRLDGRLEVAGMDVWGRRDELPYSLETRWGATGRLLNTTIATGTSIPVDGRHRGDFEPPFPDAELPDGLAPLLDGATRLLIVERGLEVSYPPNPDLIDDYAERLVALMAVARRLSMADGVYR